LTVTIDLTNSNNNATLKANNIGGGGGGGNGDGSGGSGRQGVVALSGVLDGYNAKTLSDIAGISWGPQAQLSSTVNYSTGIGNTATVIYTAGGPVLGAANSSAAGTNNSFKGGLTFTFANNTNNNSWTTKDAAFTCQFFLNQGDTITAYRENTGKVFIWEA
jgi:hypothetical protein